EAETAAAGAGADRAVEGKQRRLGRSVLAAAVRAGETIVEGLEGALAPVEVVKRDLTPSDRKGLLDRVKEPAAGSRVRLGRQPQAVDDDVDFSILGLGQEL